MQVAFDDDGAVDVHDHCRHRELVAHGLELCLGLGEARLVYAHFGELVRGLRLLDFAAAVLFLGHEVGLFEPELRLVEAQQGRTPVYHVARLYEYGVDVAVERGRGVDNLVGLEDCRRTYFVRKREERREQDERDGDEPEQLCPGVLDPENL